MKKKISSYKIKRILLNILSISTICIILVVSTYWKRVIETSISIVLFFIYRRLFDKQYHSSSLFLCSLVSVCVFIIVTIINESLALSILFTIVLTFTITCISYYIKDYLDNTILVKKYRTKLESFNCKSIENLTESEMCDLFPQFKYSTIQLVYGYLHRDKGMTAQEYAYKNNVSEQLIYKYLKQIKRKFEDLD